MVSSDSKWGYKCPNIFYDLSYPTYEPYLQVAMNLQVP